MGNNAFVWVANGNYCKEANLSAGSVAMQMPNIDRIIATPEADFYGSNFTGVFRLQKRKHEEWYLDSVNYFLQVFHDLNYDKMIFLDTDTTVIRPVDDLFSLLDRFDLVGAHAPGRITAPVVSTIPDAFPELNIGVIGMARTANMEDFLQHWYNRYELHRDVYGNNDQAPLRESLWIGYGNIRFYVLPPEYNCRFGFGGFARYDVKILHGRSSDIKAVERDINSTKGMRGWPMGKYA